MLNTIKSFLKLLASLFATWLVYNKGKQVATQEIQQQAEEAYHEHREEIQKTVQETNATIIASYNDHDLRRRMREQCTVPTRKNEE